MMKATLATTRQKREYALTAMITRSQTGYARNFLLPLMILLATACGAGERADTELATGMDTLANGAVVIHNSAEGAWREDEAWRLEPDWRIGEVDGEGPDVFGRIAGLAMDDLGRVWVLDSQANEIRVFDAAGEHIRTIGGEGGGPGEFARASGLAFGPQGRLWVIDPGNARYTVFDTTGAFVATHRRPLDFSTHPWRGGINDAGWIYEVGADRSRSYEALRTRYLLAAVAPSTGAMDTVALPYYEDARYVARYPNGHVRSAASVPFAPRLTWRFDSRGYIWFGVSDRYRIVQRTLAGDTIRIIERSFERLPVNDQERERAVERLQSFIERGGEVDLSRIPDEKAVFHTFNLDSEGYLWVQPVLSRADIDAGARAHYDVFDPSGRYLGRVRSEVGIFLGHPATIIRHNVIYSVTYGRLGVPVPGVERTRIVGRETFSVSNGISE